jgi:uncharacterized protein YjiS (DUF1127 family)
MKTSFLSRAFRFVRPRRGRKVSDHLLLDQLDDHTLRDIGLRRGPSILVRELMYSRLTPGKGTRHEARHLEENEKVEVGADRSNKFSILRKSNHWIQYR